jgi:hypothetical protein
MDLHFVFYDLIVRENIEKGQKSLFLQPLTVKLSILSDLSCLVILVTGTTVCSQEKFILNHYR